MREGSRLESLLSLCPRYVVVPPNPPDGIAFCLAGNIQDWEHMFELHDGISNCKPGIWKAEVKYVEGAERGDCDREACLRWVADLNDETELDFTITPDEWQAWEQMFKDKFDNAVKWGEGIAWKHAGTYFHDGGIFNIISTAYLTREAAVMIQEGANPEKMDDDEWGCYLETIANNEEPINEEDMIRNEDFTLGGLHYVHNRETWIDGTDTWLLPVLQDVIGGPPGIAVAEKDGRIVGIKFFMDYEELDEETLFDGQPGRVIF